MNELEKLKKSNFEKEIIKKLKSLKTKGDNVLQYLS